MLNENHSKPVMPRPPIQGTPRRDVSGFSPSIDEITTQASDQLHIAPASPSNSDQGLSGMRYGDLSLRDMGGISVACKRKANALLKAVLPWSGVSLEVLISRK
jgi:hypothetical protein